MARLTRGERFKDARIVHNQHKKQTMDEVSAATGVSKSLIQSLEDDYATRSVGYDKVVKLAEHYHVTTDYLLGLSDDPAPMRSAVDELGFSPQVIEWFLSLRSKHGDSGIANDIFLNAHFCQLVETLCDYYNSVLAEFIYHNIFLKHFPDLNDSGATQQQIDAFYDDVGSDDIHEQFEKSVAIYLYAQRAIWDWDEKMQNNLASSMTHGDGFTISELSAYRAKKNLEFTLDEIGSFAEYRFNEAVKRNGND